MEKWRPELATGHRAIDAEHKEFLRHLEAIRQALDAGAGREQIVDLILTLQQYVRGHFEREEAYMEEVACPAAAVNCAAHRVFAARFETWLQLLSIPGSPVSVMADVHRESLQWIEGHIKSVDCQLRSCRKPA